MIPAFDETGGLPAGIHEATWVEFRERYGGSGQRALLLEGLEAAARELARCGCARIYVDGSFVTDRAIPGDFDACWDLAGVLIAALDPVLRTFDRGRATQKAKYRGELFPTSAVADRAGRTFLTFFQQDKVGRPKGIVIIDLRTLP